MSVYSQMPPKNIDPDDLWSQIITLPRAHRVIESPLELPDGTKAQIAIMVLTQEESQICTIEAEKFTKKMLKENGGVPKSDEKSEGYSTLYENRSAIEVLFKCCRRVGKLDKSFFPSVGEMTKRLTTDQIAVLFREYLIVQQEIGPIISNMTKEELDAWVEKLAKGGSAHFLGFLTLAAQNQFILYMACQLYSLQTGKCLPISQPDESLTNV